MTLYHISKFHNTCNLPPEKVRDIRPPNGLFTPQILQLFNQWNYRPVMWSIVPEDWVRPGIPKVVDRVIKNRENGSLIVLHDGVCGGQEGELAPGGRSGRHRLRQAHRRGVGGDVAGWRAACDAGGLRRQPDAADPGAHSGGFERGRGDLAQLGRAGDRTCKRGGRVGDDAWA